MDEILLRPVDSRALPFVVTCVPAGGLGFRIKYQRNEHEHDYQRPEWGNINARKSMAEILGVSGHKVMRNGILLNNFILVDRRS